MPTVLEGGKLAVAMHADAFSIPYLPSVAHHFELHPKLGENVRYRQRSFACLAELRETISGAGKHRQSKDQKNTLTP